MNKIKTSDVVDPSIKQPFTARSLTFLQDSIITQDFFLAATIINDTFNQSPALAIKGCKKNSSTNWDAGYIMYLNEIYLFNGFNGPITDTAVVTLATTNDATADPVVFTDGISRNVHNIRVLQIVDGASGSGLFDMNNINYARQGWTGLSFGSGWTSPSYTASYRKNFDGLVSLKGVVQKSTNSSGTVATLPVGYRPSQSLFINVNVNGAINLIEIATDGQITVVNTVTSGTVLLYLDGINFYNF